MKIFVVILHFGDLATTQTCIKALVKVEKNIYKIVLVNNDPEIILNQSQFNLAKERLYILNNEKNTGFSRGVNKGVKYALSRKATHILLLNNDTSLTRPLLPDLLHGLDIYPSAGIAGPIIQFERDMQLMYDLGGNVNLFWGRTSHHEVHASLFSPSLQSFPVSYISGCCILIKREVFEKIGFFDEQFFLYYEDVDFALRAATAGFLSIVVPTVFIDHALSKSVGKLSKISIYHQTKSGILFGRKYCKKTRLCNLLFLFVQSVLFSLKSPQNGWIVWKAMKDGILHSI